MRTRAASLLIAVALVFGLAVCGSDGGDDSADPTTTTEKTTTTAEDGTTTTAGGSTSTTAGGEKASKEFCDAMDAIGNQQAEGLEAQKKAFAALPGMLDDVKEAAPERFADDIDAYKEVVEDLNPTVQAAKSEKELQDNEEAEKKFESVENRLDDLQTYYTSGCQS